ncbi:MAG: hypothetical protein GY856_48830 [bacterium]|nr:hypothetical protein [bacterium]
MVARLGLYDWPGNVRELRNVARWLAIAGRSSPSHELGVRLGEILDGSGAHVPRSPEESKAVVLERRLRKPAEIDEEELRAALRTHHWELSATAEALGASRAALYRLIDESPTIRKAADLGREEIEEALRRFGGELEAAAGELEVSLRGLKRRMTALGLDHS